MNVQVTERSRLQRVDRKISRVKLLSGQTQYTHVQGNLLKC